MRGLRGPRISPLHIILDMQSTSFLYMKDDMQKPIQKLKNALMLRKTFEMQVLCMVGIGNYYIFMV